VTRRTAPGRPHLYPASELPGSAKEIAAALSISTSTESTYRARIMEKLKLHSTAEITRYALRSGLVN
jgi:DNA-binding NarL/FixJ family response regulator